MSRWKVYALTFIGGAALGMLFVFFWRWADQQSAATLSDIAWISTSVSSVVTSLAWYSALRRVRVRRERQRQRDEAWLIEQHYDGAQR